MSFIIYFLGDPDSDPESEHETESESDSSDDERSEESFISKLRTWAINSNCSHKDLNGLLDLLFEEKMIPKMGSRTLLQAPKNIELVKVSNMDCFYYNVLTQLKKTLDGYADEVISSISELRLLLSTDGIKFKKSTRTSWPLLASFANLKPDVVFPLMINIGVGHPSNLEMFEESINQLIPLFNNGFEYKGRDLQLIPAGCICDLPARSYIKNTKGHTGYNSCGKCKIYGKWVGTKVVFPDLVNVPRTDQEFREANTKILENNYKYGNQDHHNGYSPFVKIRQLDMVKGFPNETMHGCSLGIMKRLLELWTKSSKSFRYRLSDQVISSISTILGEIRRCIPSEFARKPQPLSQLTNFKATSFREKRLNLYNILGQKI